MGRPKSSKVMTAAQAVEQFVHDGDTLVVGNYTEASPLALIFEVLRQKKKGMTLFSQSGNMDAEILVGGGCIDRMVSAFVHKWGGRAGGSMISRHQEAGTLEVEDYTNFSYNAMLMAGASGFSYMQVLPSIMDTDVFHQRGFMGDKKFGVLTCPFTGQKTPVVPAANPDICLVHVQRADKYGNAQHWGGLGSTVHACLASTRIIVSCEEIVDHEVVRSSPHHTIVPDFRVDAVVEEPWGAHPMELSGYYSTDMNMMGFFSHFNSMEGGMAEWLEEWVYNLPDRTSYIQRYIETFGNQILQGCKARPYYSAPTNYGIGTRSLWNAEGKNPGMNLDFEAHEKLILEKGDLVHD
jgi:glutaconate CoA-transferase, subunit A